MNSSADILKDWPELPVELFELGGRREVSKTAPVITNHPDVVVAGDPYIATPR